MYPDIFVAVIGLVSSVIAVCITYYKTKKLRFFDVYFENKVSSYNNFWIAVSEIRENPQSSENRANLRIMLYQLGMFSNEDVFQLSLIHISEPTRP